MQIEVSGVVAKWGQVDISLAIFDKYNQGEELLNLCCVEVVGGLQFSDAKVIGTIGRSEV